MSLTVSEKQKLAECEQIIERNIQAFHEAGAALMAIRDEKLYRLEFKTFEQYCQKRWNMVANYARRLIAGANVIKNINENVPMGTKPETERQIRPLTKLEPEEQCEAWKEAVETAPEGKVTAMHVERVVERRTRVSAETTKARVKGQTFSEEWKCVDASRRQLEEIGSSLKRVAKKYGFSAKSASALRKVLDALSDIVTEGEVDE